MRRLAALMLLTMSLAASTLAAEVDVWLGTVTSPNGSRGIYHVALDDETGKLSRSQLVAPIKQPGFLALHPELPVLYSTGGGGVAAHRIGRSGGRPSLSPISVGSADAGGAAHVSVDRTGKVLLAAHYGSGVVASWPLDASGAIRHVASRIEHEGGSRVVPRRQSAPHPHWIGVSPDNRFVFVPDLGLDQIVIYQLDADTATLTPHGHTPTPPGGGPRHLAFHPSGRWAYLVNELTLAITALEYNADEGALTPLQTIPTLSEEQKSGEASNSGSEVRVHPSGRFVYSANRGHDSITAFAVDGPTGKLTLVEQEPIRGSWPRNFNVDRSGRWLLAAGRDSNTLAVFQIDPESGGLRYVRSTTSVPAPICVVVGSAEP